MYQQGHYTPTANLAQATGTRIDSACKHISVGRVHTDAVLHLYNAVNQTSAGHTQDDDDFILRNKDRFAVEKMDIVVNTSAYSKLKKTNFGAYTPITNKHFTTNSEDRDKQDHNIRKMRFAGFALGHAEADGRIGDTAVSILTGGMVTIRNGPEDIFAGDQITWGISENAPTKKRTRMNSHTSTVHDCTKFIILPLGMSTATVLNPQEVIGKALTSARGWEMVDILVCRQHANLPNRASNADIADTADIANFADIDQIEYGSKKMKEIEEEWWSQKILPMDTVERITAYWNLVGEILERFKHIKGDDDRFRPVTQTTEEMLDFLLKGDDVLPANAGVRGSKIPMATTAYFRARFPLPFQFYMEQHIKILGEQVIKKLFKIHKQNGWAVLAVIALLLFGMWEQTGVTPSVEERLSKMKDDQIEKLTQSKKRGQRPSEQRVSPVYENRTGQWHDLTKNKKITIVGNLAKCLDLACATLIKENNELIVHTKDLSTHSESDKRLLTNAMLFDKLVEQIIGWKTRFGRRDQSVNRIEKYQGSEELETSPPDHIFFTQAIQSPWHDDDPPSLAIITEMKEELPYMRHIIDLFTRDFPYDIIGRIFVIIVYLKQQFWRQQVSGGQESAVQNVRNVMARFLTTLTEEGGTVV
jgi:hypothetical protein